MNQGGNGNGSHGGCQKRRRARAQRSESPRAAAGGIDRMPPQAVEVEQAVLGAMMIDSRAIGRAFEILDESCFYHAANGLIFQAMIGLYERSEAVDQLTLSEELKKREQLAEVGGVSYLAKLATEVATSANIDFHARIVLDKALSRKLIETASEVIEQAYDGTDEVQSLIDRTEERIFSLSENQIGATAFSRWKWSWERRSSKLSALITALAPSRVSIRGLPTSTRAPPGCRPVT